MNENSIEEVLVEEITELGRLEATDLELSTAIFFKKSEEIINKKIAIIQNEIIGKMKYYNVKGNMYEIQKDNILQRYRNEFEKILQKFEERFVNIQLEIQEVELNQKIAIVNIKKVLDSKNNIINSEVYLNYNLKKQELLSNIQNDSNNGEALKYNTLIDNLSNPLELYNKRINACIEKFNAYNEIIDECMIEIEICRQEFEDFCESMMKHISTELIEKNKDNLVTKLINKFLSVFKAKSDFTKEVVEKMQNELNIIENENNNLLKQIQDKTVNFTATILIMREDLNKKFELEIA